MSDALPRLVQLATVPEPQLVTDSEADFATLELGEAEPRYALLVETDVPADSDIGLSLTFLEALVIVGLDLDKGAEDILVLVRILVAQNDRLRLVVDAGLLEVFKCGIGVLTPQVFKSVDLLEGDLAGAQLFGLARRLDEPGQEGPIINERRPQCRVPRYLLRDRRTRLPEDTSESVMYRTSVRSRTGREVRRRCRSSRG